MRVVRTHRSLLVCALPAIATAAVLALAGVSAGGKNGSPLMPPQANFRGKSLQEWSILQNEWLIATGLGGETGLSDTVKGVRFLPGAFNPGEYEFDIEVRPGTPLVSATFFVFGERYDDPDVPDDNPDDPILDFIFETTFLETRLDGKVLLSGKASDLGDFGYGPVPFDEPIVYAAPQPRGPGLNAVAALFGLGVGSILNPLPPGEHTLEATIDSLFFGEFQYTYHIIVTRP